MAEYPNTIPSFSTKVDGETIEEDHVNDLQDEVVAIATELGVNPSGANTTVSDRIAALESASFAIRQIVSTSTNAQTTTASVIPYDNTIPQNTEGDQIFTASVTPNTTTNKLVCKLHFVGGAASGVRVTTALFQDSTADALAANHVYVDAAGELHEQTLQYEALANTTGSVQFKIRWGVNAGTGYMNRPSVAGLYGSITVSRLEVMELEI